MLEQNIDEHRAIIDFLKDNKAPGEDNIKSELQNIARPHSAIRKLIGIVWVNEQIPRDRNTVIVCPIFKNGNTAEIL